jgi:hypothetical protein
MWTGGERRGGATCTWRGDHPHEADVTSAYDLQRLNTMSNANRPIEKKSQSYNGFRWMRPRVSSMRTEQGGCLIEATPPVSHLLPKSMRRWGQCWGCGHPPPAIT